MMCDSANAKLDCLVNNNNVVTQNNDTKMNGYDKLNGNGNAKAPVELEEEIASRKSLIILLSIFVTSLAAMMYIYKNFPELEA